MNLNRCSRLGDLEAKLGDLEVLLTTPRGVRNDGHDALLDAPIATGVVSCTILQKYPIRTDLKVKRCQGYRVIIEYLSST